MEKKKNSFFSLLSSSLLFLFLFSIITNQLLTSTNWSAILMCSASILMSSGVAIATIATARSLPNVLYAHDRTERMNLTAASPLLATSTEWIARSPPISRQRASTWELREGTRLGTPILSGLEPCLRGKKVGWEFIILFFLEEEEERRRKEESEKGGSLRIRMRPTVLRRRLRCAFFLFFWHAFRVRAQLVWLRHPLFLNQRRAEPSLDGAAGLVMQKRGGEKRERAKKERKDFKMALLLFRGTSSEGSELVFSFSLSPFLFACSASLLLRSSFLFLGSRVLCEQRRLRFASAGGAQGDHPEKQGEEEEEGKGRRKKKASRKQREELQLEQRE